MTEKEYWLTSATDDMFERMSMTAAVRELADRCWYKRRYYDIPELSVEDPAVLLTIEAIGFDRELFERYVEAQSRMQEIEFEERFRELYGECM